MSTNYQFTIQKTHEVYGDRQDDIELHTFEMYVPNEAIRLEVSIWQVQGDSVPICKALDASDNVLHHVLPQDKRFATTRCDWDAVEFTSFDDTEWERAQHKDGNMIARVIVRKNRDYSSRRRQARAYEASLRPSRFPLQVAAALCRSMEAPL